MEFDNIIARTIAAASKARREGFDGTADALLDLASDLIAAQMTSPPARKHNTDAVHSYH